MIYLDYHASTPCDPHVVDAMLPYFSEQFANPSSATHKFGKAVYRAVDQARQQVAELIGAEPKEIVFTSGEYQYRIQPFSTPAIQGISFSCL